MRRILAVASLDWRRLAFGLVSGALVAGLVPALASGLGEKVEVGAILTVAFGVVGLAAGATFGSDFSDGKSSFFLARPLPTGVLIAGRFTALLALAIAAFVSFMVSCWISSSDRSLWTLSVLTRVHAEVLLSTWSVSLFVSLAAAARGRGVRADGGMRAMLLIPVRLALSMGAFLLIFGLFADLVLRAYSNDIRPIRLFGLSWVVACFVASCVAIAGGRTERLRISRFQGGVMAAHFALVSVVVVGAWIYVLHPGPEAIRRVDYPARGSNDGRAAYVWATVDRGGQRAGASTFRPLFIVDITSGQARRLNADANQGPWESADGRTMVWSEATPFFFRPLWRRMGGGTSFRVKTASGEILPMPMPRALSDFSSVKDLTRFGDTVEWVLPSPDGDVFAIQWDRHLTFTSRTRGELSDIETGRDRTGASRSISLRQSVFLESGKLRATLSLQSRSGDRSVEFADIDPGSGAMQTVASVSVASPALVHLDEKAGRALLTSIGAAGQGGSLSLLGLGEGAHEAHPTVLVKDVLFPRAIFLKDGRIAVANGGAVGAWNKRELKIFSPTGRMLLDIPMGEGSAPRLDREVFEGVLAVNTGRFSEELSLIDVGNGATLRRLPNMLTPSWIFRSTTPPGSPAARLLQSSDDKLYELPSITAEPRLLLPLERR